MIERIQEADKMLRGKHEDCHYLRKKLAGDEIWYHCELNDMRLCDKEYGGKCYEEVDEC